MNKKLLKLTSVVTLSAGLILTSVSDVLAAEAFKLNKSTKIYMNADNARRQVNSRGRYAAGNYYVYKKYNGMVNITRTAGVAGGWIKPTTNTTVAAPVSNTTAVNKVTTVAAGQVKLDGYTKGYYTAADAKYGRNQRTTLGAGTYYIYKTYNGMINVSRRKSSAGAWINPGTIQVAKPTPAPVAKPAPAPVAKPAPVVKSPVANTGTYVLSTSKAGYMNAADAKYGRNQRATLSAGTYYIFKSYNGMLNLTRTKGSAGAWVNPNSATKVATAAPVATKPAPTTTVSKPVASTSTSPSLYTLRQFRFKGVIRWNGLKFTYYSQSVLPGNGLRIPGRHVNAGGYVADSNGYIVLAAKGQRGKVINTPFGYKGKVYDYCAACTLNWYDVYTK